MKWGLKLIYGINVLLSLISLLSYLSPFVDPSITWFFSFFGLGYPILLLLNVFFIVFWLISKPKFVFLSLLTLAVGIGPLCKTIGFNKQKNVEGGIKVMTYNIGHTKYFLTEENQEERVAEFKDFIQSQNPDIICIQERTRRHLPFYEDVFSDYSLYPEEYIGTCIYSKGSILDSGNIYFDTNAHNATWVDLKVDGKIVRIYSIHLSSNKVKLMSDNIKEIWDESLFILDKYNLHSVKRIAQLREILKHAKSSPHPVMMTGDFNDVPMSYLYRLVTKEYNDAFSDHGLGFGKTHNTKIPILRIDYAFYTDEIQVLDQDLIHVNYSDHFPLVTTIELEQ